MKLDEVFPDRDIPPSVRIARVPSPLEHNPLASSDLGVDLWMKREDVIDDLGCGHKVRKLGYVLADALAQEATVLLTAASLPSSQAVAVAAGAPRHGMRAHLVYCGDQQVKPVAAHGSYLLVALLGATVTWHERSPWSTWTSLLHTAAEAERERGETPYLIVPGISEGPGLFGSIELGIELAAQLDSLALGPIHVVAPAGSGGTCVGLAVAANALDVPWRVHGISIAAVTAVLRDAVAKLSDGAVTFLGRAATRVEINLYDGAVGVGYDQPDASALDVMREALVRYGLILDPTYMVKTFIGLRHLIAQGVIPVGATVVLIHTGGSLGVFAGNQSLRTWYREQLKSYLAREAADARSVVDGESSDWPPR